MIQLKQLTFSKQLRNAFPYVFAFTVGQTVKNFAAWRLQCGVSLGDLEQLMGSTTVGGTITVHALLRPFNGLAIGLALLWASSPLGNYLIPNLGREVQQALVLNTTIRYLDTTQASFFYNPDFIPEISAGGINALYQSSLISSRSAQGSKMDQWGNVKIPYYSRLNATNKMANASDWRHTPESGSPWFSSLLGIPISGLAASGNTTFTITTTYLDLNCYNISQGPPIVEGGVDENGSAWIFGPAVPTLNSSRPLTFFLAINRLVPGESGALGTYANTTAAVQQPALLFQSIIWDNVVNPTDPFNVSRIQCRLTQEYIDSAVSCSPGSPQYCRVTASRPSSATHPPNSITTLGLQYQFQMISQLLPIATGESSYSFVPESTATELYIDNSSLPFSIFGRAHLYGIPKSDLEVRLGQVLNTYTLAALAPFDMAGSLGSGNASVVSVKGEQRVWEIRYQVEWTLFAAYIATWLVFFAAGVAGVLLRWVVIGPDVLGYVSSLTRDTPYVRVTEGGSALAGIERAKLLRGLRLKMGDVGEGTEGVGRVAVSDEKGGGVRPLTEERLYL